MPGFQCLSQNVDGLSVRAEHPPEQLQLLHGNLFDLKCTSKLCGYREQNFTDPVAPALAIPTDGGDPTTTEAQAKVAKDLDISDPNVPIPSLKVSDLPQCPKCQERILRPAVVWFGENLPQQVLKNVDSFLNVTTGTGEYAQIDLIIVIGTSAKVYPAAGYIDEARERGARVCVVNMDANDAPPSGWEEGDWMFQGDAAVIVPELLKPVIGEVKAKV
jgi:NAD-dependent SIR2 family protein deacetylase